MKIKKQAGSECRHASIKVLFNIFLKFLLFYKNIQDTISQVLRLKNY
jgi:hypothetical protein